VGVLTSVLGLALLSGAGLVLLGRPRRALAWIALGVAVFAMFLVGARLSSPRMFALGLALTVAVGIAAVVDTAIAPLGERAPAIHPLIFICLMLAGRYGIALAARTWIVEAFQMPSGSMMPTLLIGDHFFVAKNAGPISRGDVVVFKFPLDQDVDYVKRVAGVGGDQVEIKSDVVFVNGKPFTQSDSAEPCVPETEGPCSSWQETMDTGSHRIFRDPVQSRDVGPFPVAPGHFFVLGDHRHNSNDSRAWGTVPAELVKGRALFIWWSREPRGGVRWERVGSQVH
jgi:signal peptidase I